MSRRSLPFAAALSLVAFPLAGACHGDHDHSEDDHADGDSHAHDEAGVPAEYAGMTNPLTANADVLAAAEMLYGQHCAGCHGAQGLGDGESGRDLTPAPTDLTDDHVLDAADDYLFYRISEGGGGCPARC